MRLYNTHIRENGKKRNLFDKVNEIKEKIKVIVPEIDEHKWLIIIHHVRQDYEGKYYYGRAGSSNIKLKLTNTERLIQELLIKEGLNPSTVYRWFLAARVPSDVMYKLRKGMISAKKAYEISVNRKKNQKSGDMVILMENIQNYNLIDFIYYTKQPSKANKPPL
ncbi:MAG TPA: hypothetical protein VJB90_00305 [Candidatus Nanoarchaeia archaeon]|nr:hypothetical protein [Candidatus Nanoarchaeia archaeon]